MKKALLAILFIAFFASFAAAQQHGTGVILNDSAYNKSIQQPLLPSPSLPASLLELAPKESIYTPPPNAVSLRIYTPVPGNQFDCESCVGWACAYEALTTMWAIQNHVVNKAEITKNAFDPNYLYYSIANSCSEGSQITDAVLAMRDKGVPLTKDLPKPVDSKADLNLPPNKLHKILLFNKVFELSSKDDNIIVSTEANLAGGYPVIVVCVPDNNLYNLKGPKQRKVWVPEAKPENPHEGHAMCVIGYDKFKRQFEVMNSWGTKWGDDGYFYINYDDFANVVRYAYFITPNMQYMEDNVSIVDVAGDFEIDKKDAGRNTRFNEIKPVLSGSRYVIGKGIKEGDTFRLDMLNVQDNMNIYVVGLGPDNRAVVLFPGTNPKGRSTVAVDSVSEDNNIFVTPLNKNGSEKLNAGIYNYCVLYCRNGVGIDDVVKQINEEPGRHSFTKIQDILGPRLIPKGIIDYKKGNIKARDVINSGDIVPIYFSIAVKR